MLNQITKWKFRFKLLLNQNKKIAGYNWVYAQYKKNISLSDIKKSISNRDPSYIQGANDALLELYFFDGVNNFKE